MATRMQQRLNARYARDPSQANQDAVIGLALHKYHAARITPIHAAVRDHGVYATGRQLCKAGVHFIDAFVAIFGVMPKGSWK